MHCYHEPTMNLLHRSIARSLLMPRDQVDDATSSSVSRHNILAVAESCESWNFPLHKLWVQRSRWTAVVSQYLDKGAMELWLEQCASMKKSSRGICLLRTNMVKGWHTGTGETRARGQSRRFGSCILAFSFRRHPTYQLTMHSRTSHIGYIGGLDLSMAYCLADEVARAAGIARAEMRFVWQAESLQFHPLRSMGYLFAIDPEWALRTIDRDSSPAMWHSRNWLNKYQAMDERNLKYSDMTFVSVARVRKRWHTEVMGYDYACTFAGPGETGLLTVTQNAYTPLPHLYPSMLSIDFSKRAQRAVPDFDKVEVSDD